jgi:hypothetical protein
VGFFGEFPAISAASAPHFRTQKLASRHLPTASWNRLPAARLTRRDMSRIEPIG